MRRKRAGKLPSFSPANRCGRGAAWALLLACGGSPSQPPRDAAQASAGASEPGQREADSPGSEPTPPPPLLEPSQPDASSSKPETKQPTDTRNSETIGKTIADHRPNVRACYDAALAENPDIQGDLVVSFVIDPWGVVKSAEVNWNESEIHVPELDTCAVEAVKNMRFPPSSRGLETRVNYPFNFNPPPPSTGPAPLDDSRRRH